MIGYQEKVEDRFYTIPQPHEGWEKWNQQKVTIDNSEKPWYLATVYSNFIRLYSETMTQEEALEEAYQMACEQLAVLLKAGIFTYCPIAMNHGASKYIKILEHSFWLQRDMQFLRICKGLIVTKMKTWEDSFGIAQEIKLAKELNMPIYYCNFGELPEELKNVRY